MLRPDLAAVVLAPMEGVTDAAMRAVQGRSPAFTYAVTEFLRVSEHVPPRHVFLSHMPELRCGGRTPTGMPVQLQLLGGDAGRLAESAARAVEVGASGIDLNFGCPAPTVNRHDGGASLLRYPKRIREIVTAVRRAVPLAIPVSAKVRLGWDSIDAIDENAEMVAEGGANWLTVHGRTRMAGYAPPVFWRPIGRVRERLGLPVVANGDIWNLTDFRRCREETGCIHFMLGRGALADPRLPRAVAGELGLLPRTDQPPGPIDWACEVRELIEWTARTGGGYDRPRKLLSRLKQWLRMASAAGTFARFDVIRQKDTCESLVAALE